MLQSSRLKKTILIGCGFLIALHAVASFFPQLRLWGVNLLYYLPPFFRSVLVISGMVILVPPFNEVVGNFFAGFFPRIIDRSKKINRYYKYALLSFMGGILFWAFRVKAFLLGDSFFRARGINLGQNISFTEPLDFFLHAKLAKLTGGDAFKSYAVISVLAGMMFLFLIWLLADLMAKDKPERFLVFAIIASLGANQLFFGYVESYTLVYVAIFAYLIFCLGYLKHKNGLILPIIAFLLACSLHLLTITLLPSLLYLIFAQRSKKNRTKRGKEKLTKVLVSLGIVILVVAGLLLLQSYNPEKQGLSYYLIYPLGIDEDFYSIFSSAHLLDLINHQLLVSPIGFLILLASVLTFWQKLDLKENVVRFLLIVTGFSLGFAFFLDPKLGYPRDWDLFAFTGLGYTLLGIYIFLKYGKETKVSDLKYITLCLLFTSLFSTVPWVYVNAVEKKSVERFEHLLVLDKERSAYGYETLAMHYDRHEQWEKEIQQWEKAFQQSRQTRYINCKAAIYNKLQMFDRASEELQRSLEIDPSDHYAHFGLAEVFGRMGKYEQAIEEFQQAIKINPRMTPYYENLGVVLANLGRYPDAITVFEQGLKVNPGYFTLYRNLGYSYLNINDSAGAEKYLRLYLEYSPRSEDQTKVQETLRDLSQ